MVANMQEVSAAEVKTLLAEGRATLIDVRSEEDFEARHLPGAHQAHLYKMSFADDVRARGARPDQTLILYGYTGKRNGLGFAHYKLNKAGFKDIRLFSGGLDAWLSAGFPAEGHRKDPPSPPNGTPEGRLSLHLEKSVVNWHGRNWTSRHFGTLQVSGGHLTFAGDVLKSVEARVDLQSLKVQDLQGELAGVLRSHLLNEDFFEADRYPEASFQSTRIEPLTEASVGRPNYRVEGLLTLRGQSHAVHLLAMVGRDATGVWHAHGTLEFDRTKWGAIYGSGKFFERLGMHLVADFIGIDVHLAAAS